MVAAMVIGKVRVLVIEDDAPIRQFLRTSLLQHDYDVTEATTGAEGIELATQQTPDLVILDLGLPDMEGIDVLGQLRLWLNSPVIALSERSREQDKVDALDAGADDYVTKPFGVRELMARMRAILRRGNIAPAASKFTVGELEVDVAARQVRVRGELVHLTPMEFRLLAFLVQHAGKVLTHRAMLEQVWGLEYRDEIQYLRVFMAGLRRKIETNPAQPRYLLTEQGVGYRLADE